MLSPDQTPDTSVSGAGDPAGRRRGRRAAVAVSGGSAAFSPSSGAPRLDATVSPRRAARAAREAAAAAALSAPGSSADAAAPVSPFVPVSPVVAPAAVVASVAVTPSTELVGVQTAPMPIVGAGVQTAQMPIVAAPTVAAQTVAAPTRRSTFVAAPAPASGPRRRIAAGVAPSRRPAVARRSAVVAAAPAVRRKRTAVDTVRRVAVTTVVVGILATSVLPVLQQRGSAAYASGSDLPTTTTAGAQAYDVSTGVANSVASRDEYGATSVLDYEQQVISNRLAETNTTYTGPTAADYLAHPLFSNSPLDRAQVFQVALQYLGTPYVHGGADPSAFDCSGFIMFVYAQFGISLPHYVPSQDALGTRIPESEAVPGDVVIFDNGAHDGFYAGNGMIMDAPKPGGHISVRPIWDQPHHFVRFGD
ncbi:putative endopeptidase p60 [Frondihabitans sp. 762G35]|uniref:C40 family peptidase n=1 Tax=Frondihabitans sp. 762G35 TaxID=1446794 RepID=UPI000D207AF7|nr:C40 family peptidase [Frondihabitans sp. 762G35]ARC58467.1 putative endopeptidase p60 [Frondihabitans sp. 762G35]